MEQLNNYKKEIKEVKDTKKTEPSALVELRTWRDRTLENLKHIDRRLKRANGLEGFDKIQVERRKAFNKYSSLKSEVKKVGSTFAK